MTHYHAVMIDETGCEFGASILAESKQDAIDELRDMYPESQIDQIESPEDTRAREHRMYIRIQKEMDGDFSEWEYERDN